MCYLIRFTALRKASAVYMLQQIRAINQGRASPLTSPQRGSDTQICGLRRNFDQKPLKVGYKVSLSKNFQRESCSVINYLSNGINILAGDDPVPIKFGPKGTDPVRKDARFTFHTQSTVQSAIADLVIIY